MKTFISVLILLSVAPACSDTARNDVRAADKSAKASEKLPSDYSADNTGRNVRDKDGESLTPMDQSQAKADLELTQRIRQALMDDAALSINAQNIKIIAQNGTVTLRGPVQDQAELDSVLVKAKAIAGVREIDNQLEIRGT